MGSNRLDGIAGTFADIGILLVGKLLPEGLDGPGEFLVRRLSKMKV